MNRLDAIVPVPALPGDWLLARSNKRAKKFGQNCLQVAFVGSYWTHFSACSRGPDKRKSTAGHHAIDHGCASVCKATLRNCQSPFIFCVNLVTAIAVTVKMKAAVVFVLLAAAVFARPNEFVRSTIRDTKQREHITEPLPSSYIKVIGVC